MYKPQLAIVLLNWNGRALLEEFLPSIVTHTPLEKADIVVIDNGSTDDSLSWLESHYPSIQVVALEENYGFAKGYNLGLRKLDYPYYCLLNTDLAVSPLWIERPLELLQQGIAAVQPKLRSYRQPTFFEYAGAAGGALDRWGYPFCRGRIFETVEEDLGQYDEEVAIFWASGAALFVRRDYFWLVGGFDDSYFAHMEEIDLCWRLWLSGGEVRFTPRSEVYHVGGATLQAGDPRKSYLNFRNNLRMLYKNLPTQCSYRKILFVRLWLDTLAALIFAVTGKPKHAWATLRAISDFYRTRRGIVRSATQSWYQVDHRLPKTSYSILWQYYLRGRRSFIQD